MVKIKKKKIENANCVSKYLGILPKLRGSIVPGFPSRQLV